ncbi:two-component system capsular synthesis response regulator RcsB [Pseudomonas sp. TE6288]|uniref:response regulator n=1 Tax=Pseudomonas sp. WC1 TaxID=3424772 RepID=UPI003D355440
MGSSLATIRVAVLDDHAVVRCGVLARLAEEADIHVVGSYASSCSMIAGLRGAPADVLLVDYSLGPDEVDGVSLIRGLMAKFPTCAIVVFSSHHELSIVNLVLRVGARGFVSKNQDLGQVVTAIRSASRGKTYLDTDMTFRLAQASVDSPIRQPSVQATECSSVRLEGVRLSAKESEVIRCFLEGLSVREIAKKFERSEKTISTQKWAAFRKLGVMSDAELFKLKHQLRGF